MCRTNELLDIVRGCIEKCAFMLLVLGSSFVIVFQKSTGDVFVNRLGYVGVSVRRVDV